MGRGHHHADRCRRDCAPAQVRNPRNLDERWISRRKVDLPTVKHVSASSAPFQKISTILPSKGASFRERRMPMRSGPAILFASIAALLSLAATRTGAKFRRAKAERATAGLVVVPFLPAGRRRNVERAAVSGIGFPSQSAAQIRNAKERPGNAMRSGASQSRCPSGSLLFSSRQTRNYKRRRSI